MVKASDKLLDGFPHTRGNAIVLQEGMLQQALANPELMSRKIATPSPCAGPKHH